MKPALRVIRETKETEGRKETEEKQVNRERKVSSCTHSSYPNIHNCTHVKK